MGNCRLIYRSTCAGGFISNEALRKLVEQSAENNRADAITGLLLLSGDQFLQVLEGPSDAVNRLYGRIVQDPRHENVRLVSFEPIGPAYFDEWNMYLLDLFDLTKHPREFLAHKYGSADGAIAIPDRLHEIFSLLLDAKSICRGRPWERACAPDIEGRPT
jgi:hypothetical protein